MQQVDNTRWLGMWYPLWYPLYTGYTDIAYPLIPSGHPIYTLWYPRTLVYPHLTCPNTPYLDPQNSVALGQNTPSFSHSPINTMRHILECDTFWTCPKQWIWATEDRILGHSIQIHRIWPILSVHLVCTKCATSVYWAYYEYYTPYSREDIRWLYTMCTILYTLLYPLIVSDTRISSPNMPKYTIFRPLRVCRVRTEHTPKPSFSYNHDVAHIWTPSKPHRVKTNTPSKPWMSYIPDVAHIWSVTSERLTMDL